MNDKEKFFWTKLKIAIDVKRRRKNQNALVFIIEIKGVLVSVRRVRVGKKILSL